MPHIESTQPNQAGCYKPRHDSWTVAEYFFQGCSPTEGFKGTLQGSTNKLFAIGLFEGQNLKAVSDRIFKHDLI
jgi:hypothetical protein